MTRAHRSNSGDNWQTSTSFCTVTRGPDLFCYLNDGYQLLQPSQSWPNPHQSRRWLEWPNPCNGSMYHCLPVAFLPALHLYAFSTCFSLAVYISEWPETQALSAETRAAFQWHAPCLRPAPSLQVPFTPAPSQHWHLGRSWFKANATQKKKNIVPNFYFLNPES